LPRNVLQLPLFARVLPQILPDELVESCGLRLNCHSEADNSENKILCATCVHIAIVAVSSEARNPAAPEKWLAIMAHNARQTAVKNPRHDEQRFGLKCKGT